MKKLITIILLAVALLPQASYAQPLGTKSALNPFNVYQNPQTGENYTFFKKSTALIIANYEYKNGWADLPDVKIEYHQLADSLFRLGFDTIIRLNLTKDRMEKEIRWFINNYGYDGDEARILVYYSGHGNVTMEKSEDRGYVVPVDAPLFTSNADFEKLEDYSNYKIDYKKKQYDFERKAVSYDQWVTWAKDLRIKHALFLFDCCFAGQILHAQKSNQYSVEIEKAVRNKAVEFITASDKDQTAPGRSTFLEYFLLAISGKDTSADANGDHYLKTSELYDYLSVNVNREVNDNPRKGGLRQETDKQGEFVFRLPQSQSFSQRDVPIIINESKIITYGSIELTTEIAGKLYLGNEFKKNVSNDSRYTLNNVPTGTYTLRIEGNETWQETVNVTKNPTTIAISKSNLENNIIESQGIHLKDCSNIETEKYYNGYSLITVDKSFALINSLISITERFDCNVKAVIDYYPVQDSIQQETISWTTSNLKIGNRLKLDIKGENDLKFSKEIVSQRYEETWDIKFTTGNFEYRIENHLSSYKNDEKYAGSVFTNGVKIYFFKDENGINEIIESDNEKLTFLFTQLTTYLATLGCTVEVVQAEDSRRGQTENQEYVCLRADKEKFAENVKSENSKPK